MSDKDALGKLRVSFATRATFSRPPYDTGDIGGKESALSPIISFIRESLLDHIGWNGLTSKIARCEIGKCLRRKQTLTRGAAPIQQQLGDTALKVLRLSPGHKGLTFVF